MFVTAMLFALVQGATEFVPVSSSGHLVLLTLLLGEDGEPLLLISWLHVVTALAAIVYYRRGYWRAVCGIWKPGAERHFAWRYAGTQAITTVVIAGLIWILPQILPDFRRYDWLLGVMMLVNGVILFLAPRREDEPWDGALPALTWRAAIWMGLAQGIAVVPGLSRSGLTVAAGLRAGLSPAPASSFCFLLAPPVMLAPSLYFLAKSWPEVSASFSSWQSVAVTLAVAVATFLLAMGSLHWTVSWVRAGRLWWFAPWSGLVGGAAIVIAVW